MFAVKSNPIFIEYSYLTGMPLTNPFQISPLGDSALLISFGNDIEPGLNGVVLQLALKLNSEKLIGVKDIVPAYSSIGIYYDMIQIKSGNPATAFELVTNWIQERVNDLDAIPAGKERKIEVPVCYSRKYGIDLDEMAEKLGLTIDQIIVLHTQKKYRVYMLGFLPGFAYMGEVDDRIALSRRDQPRLKVDAGSIGIAGKQTGIYPLDSPGGWQIIGKTPLKIFDKSSDDPVLFHPGDEVEFYSITEDEFENY